MEEKIQTSICIKSPKHIHLPEPATGKQNNLHLW